MSPSIATKMTAQIQQASGDPSRAPYERLLAEAAAMEQPALIVAKVEAYE